jgi:hypothetical protein
VSADQDVTPKKTKSNSGNILKIGGIATALAIINLVTNGTEAQSLPVVILQYVALALGLFVLVGGIVLKMSRK